MYKECKVVALPSEKGRICVLEGVMGDSIHTSYFETKNKADYYHLYFVSKEFIKSGDYIYEEDIKTVNKAGENYVNKGSDYKVIALTDYNLTWELPFIDSNFISLYVEGFNSNGYILNEILVKEEGKEVNFKNTISFVFKEDSDQIKRDKELSLRCECSSEIISFVEDGNTVSIAIYALQDPRRKLSLWDRFRILFGGDVYNDNIILSKKQAKRLKNWL